MVVTLGEIMLRLSPPGVQRISQARQLDLQFGGGEANVAVSLAGFGLPSRFVTKLPENSLGESCRRELQKWGVDTSGIQTGGNRLGIYFYEKGASQRPSQVIYDRAGSAMAEAVSEDFDWKHIFQGAKWFHFTGITPALSEQTARLTLEACQAAKREGVSISCDLNYRKKLWSREQAQTTMTQLMPYIDVLIANEEDAKDVFGIAAPDSSIDLGRLNAEGYRYVANRLRQEFAIGTVAITLRESLSASENRWAALLCSKEGTYLSRKYHMHVVDRVGGGDSFCAGLIYGMLQEWEEQAVLEYAVAASCLKHTIEGDFNLVSVEEVRRLVQGDGSGRVQR